MSYVNMSIEQCRGGYSRLNADGRRATILIRVWSLIYIYIYTNERIALSCGALFSFAGRAKLSWGVYAVQSIASNVEKGGGALGTAKRGNKYF